MSREDDFTDEPPRRRDDRYSDEPRRRDRDDDDDDRPRRRSRDDDDYPDVRRPRQLSGMDGFFTNTGTFVLAIVLIICCWPVPLILGIIGLATCKDDSARQRALIVTIVSGVLGVIGVGLNIALRMNQ
jgi:hypothetical protein